MAASSLNPNTAVSQAASSVVGDSAYPNLCDHYVANMYGLDHSGYPTAAAHWAQTPDQFKHAGDGQPPVGALVFFGTGKPAGHVAIVTGYDKAGNPLVTTTHTNNGQPRTMTLAQVGMQYEGWAQPFFQGKTAALKNVTPADKTQPTPVNADVRAGDKSGIDQSPDVNTSMVPDRLSPKVLAREYGYALRVMKSDDELWKLFQKASNDQGAQWDVNRFTAELQGTKWWANHNQYAREAMTAQAIGGEDWKLRQQKAENAVREAATTIGSTATPEQLAAIRDQYITQGWDKRPDGQQLMNKALSATIGRAKDGSLLGTSGDLETELKATALANGLNLSDDYFSGAAKSVALGLTTANDWQREVRSQAASLWPTWQDKIMGGVDARALASGYINVMAQTLEVDPNSIDVNDPTLRSAMTRLDEKGNAVPLGLSDFGQQLRNDPRWFKTQQYADKFSSTATDLLKMFGLQGGA